MGSIPFRVFHHKFGRRKTIAAMSPPADDRPADWIEVVVQADPAAEDVLVWRLTELSGRGVAVDDSRPDRVVLTAWFEPERWAEAKAKLKSFFHKVAMESAGTNRVQPASTARRSPDTDRVQATFAARRIRGEDWTQAWRKFFRPIRPAPGLVVRPPWETADLTDGEIQVVIDPGQAFGTGHHQSTALCLRLLVHAVRPGPDRILDVGCGSGILALAGLMLGASRAVGLDIDPLAARASRHNAVLNDVRDRLDLVIGGPECLRGRWPLVTANLTARDLIEFSGELTRLTAPGGRLIASGLMSEQADEVQAAFGRPAWSEVIAEAMEGWTALRLGRGERD
jgi:ribosomal protein L11 methyltransferase